MDRVSIKNGAVSVMWADNNSITLQVITAPKDGKHDVICPDLNKDEAIRLKEAIEKWLDTEG
jgi:hypothetical protein